MGAGDCRCDASLAGEGAGGRVTVSYTRTTTQRRPTHTCTPHTGYEIMDSQSCGHTHTFAFNHCLSYGGAGRCLRRAPVLSLEPSLPARHLLILLAFADLTSAIAGGPPAVLAASLWSSEAVEYSSTSKLRCRSRRLLNLGSCSGMTSLSRKVRFLGEIAFWLGRTDLPVSMP